jgi:7-cyano-7-deazaguanine synthase
MEWGSVKQIVETLQKRNMPINEPKDISITSIGELHGKYKAPRRKGSFFPFRNLILASIGALYGYHLKIFKLSFGFVKDSFCDCTPSFQSKLSQVLSESVPQEISVIAPFIDQHKSDIVRYGGKHNFPYKLTYSCYEGRNDHCGKCSGCEGRRRAFKEAGIDDPTIYENQY